MKIIVKLAASLTIISFVIFTKSWYALPIDAPGTIYSGFPFPYIGNGWATSMSYQFFILEFLIDLGLYFSFWLLISFSVNDFLKIKVRRSFTTITWIAYAPIILYGSLILLSDGNTFNLKRDYKIKVIKTGYAFCWQIIIPPKNDEESVRK
jgi:hypothetical protein